MRTVRVILLLLGLLLCVGQVSSQTTPAKKKRRAVERYDTGSFFGVSVDAGVSGLGYSIAGGSTAPMPALGLNFDYIYFFTSSWGLGTGARLSYYGQNAHLAQPLVWTGLSDYEGHSFDHIIEPNDWRERQNMYMLEVPLAVHYKYKPFQSGWFATLAVRLGVPLATTYTHYRGGLTNKAYYPLWDVEMHDLPDRFETVAYKRQHDRCVGLIPLSVLTSVEIGGLWQLTKRVDLRLSAFVDVSVNNMLAARQVDKPRLGFAGEGNQAYDYMPRYTGLIGTDMIAAVRPWTVGVKAGVSIYSGLTEQQKKKKVKEFLRTYDQYIERDTILVRDTIVLQKTDTVFLATSAPAITDTVLLQKTDTVMLQKTDTVYVTKIREVMVSLDSLLSEAVIWFDFDDTEPKLEPADILDKVAQMLIGHPGLKVHVNGHACDIGTDAYNLTLAMRRAQAVASRLRAKGVKNEQLDIRSFGSDAPYRYNKEHQRSKDRRVEIIPFY